MAEVKYPADGNLRVAWVPGDDGIGNIHTPEVSELTDAAVVDLSCHIQSGGVNLGVSTNTVDTGSICSAFVSQANGRTTVAPVLTGWRYKQPEDTFWDIVEKGEVGYLVLRTGVPYETPFEAGQEVTVALVEMSEPAPEFPGGDTMTTFQVNMALVSGDKFDQKAEVVTVASA